MKKQFFTTIQNIFENDNRTILLLGDIGVFGFSNVLQKYPDRAYNIGILEQSTVGLAAGLAMTGFIPIVHTIAPFLVERSYEQLKLDFGYQKLGGNFISVGSSYDYAALGCTHHCPADVGILKNIPGMEIVVPGTAEEFDSLFKQAYSNDHPTYYRLSERQNDNSYPVSFGKATIIKKGSKATVIAVGPALKSTLDACEHEDVTILYYTTVHPFDRKTLHSNIRGNKIIMCEPYYSGAAALDISIAAAGKKIQTAFIGIPLEFLRHYGTLNNQDKFLQLTANDIRRKIKRLIKA